MFIDFEGIDGSGKTTVSNQVAERLRAGGLSVKHLRAEGKSSAQVLGCSSRIPAARA